VARFPIRLFETVVGITVGVFAGTWIATGNFGRTWDVLVGVSPPFGSWAWLTLPLSALGYFAVPVSVALVVTDAITRHTRGLLRDKTIVEHEITQGLDSIFEAWKQQNGLG
jgi:hypothetical protein